MEDNQGFREKGGGSEYYDCQDFSDCSRDRVGFGGHPNWFRDHGLVSPSEAFQANGDKQIADSIRSDLASSYRTSSRPVWDHLGTIPVEFEPWIKIGIETFTLAERFQSHSLSLPLLWRHSLRTGYVAAFITQAQLGDSHAAWEAFVGGVLHDIGHVVFLTEYPSDFSRVIDVARKQGKGISLVESDLLGASHGELGEMLLNRWGVEGRMQQIVRYHDEPFSLETSDFTSLTGVYIANMLDGGGVPQDGDGTIGVEGEIYLKSLGLWDKLPTWQTWLHSVPLERV